MITSKPKHSGLQKEVMILVVQLVIVDLYPIVESIFIWMIFGIPWEEFNFMIFHLFKINSIF